MLKINNGGIDQTINDRLSELIIRIIIRIIRIIIIITIIIIIISTIMLIKGGILYLEIA